MQVWVGYDFPVQTEGNDCRTTLPFISGVIYVKKIAELKAYFFIKIFCTHHYLQKKYSIN